MHQAERSCAHAGGHLRVRLLREEELSSRDHHRISSLLVEAFPHAAQLFSRQSWRGPRPDRRLLLEGGDGELLAHLDYVIQPIQVADATVEVAGVGEVAVRQGARGRGLGTRLMQELKAALHREPVDFGLLYCLESVAGFYERVGWTRVHQPSRFISPETGQWMEASYPTFILPVRAPLEAWPREGVIDLGGMIW